MKNSLPFFLVFLLGALVSCQSNGPRSRDLSAPGSQDMWKPTGDGLEAVFEGNVLKVAGNPGQLVFEEDASWRNFELTAEVKTSPGGCSSLMFHMEDTSPEMQFPGYEVLLNSTCDSTGGKLFLPRTGSLLAVRNVYYPMSADGDWFSLQVKVVENHIEIWINGIRVTNYVEPDEPWRGSGHEGRRLGSGKFRIRHYAGETAFRSVKVVSLPAGEKSAPMTNAGWDAKVTRLMEQGFPLIDFHIHLKGGLTNEQAIENSQKLGINYGIAPNCGLKFPVTDDISLAAYMDTVRGMPIFRGMQAEGREWITLFSPGAIAKFDYVFTDALTFTDYKGRRTRMWIPEEVWVDDKQQFMDQLVGKIEAIFSQEPVDIYVNPTLLPAALMPEYDQLWTPERIKRVVGVLKDNNIALEINARYRVPHEAIIGAAKEAGLKFSFGTNNGAADLGQLDYCLDMLEKFGLTAEDMFLPVKHDRKPVLVKGLPEKITG